MPDLGTELPLLVIHTMAENVHLLHCQPVQNTTFERTKGLVNAGYIKQKTLHITFDLDTCRRRLYAHA